MPTARSLAAGASRLVPFGVVAALVMCFAWLVFVPMESQRQVRADRATAWDAAMARADSLEGRRILAFARSSAEGRDCRPSGHQPDLGFHWGYQATYRAALDYRIQAEQACLEQLKGQFLAGQPEGHATILDLALPR